MMDKEIKIRLATQDDLSTVIALDQLTLNQIWSLQQYQRELNLPNSRFWLLCLTNNSEIEVMGMGCWRKIAADVEIPLFAIHPFYQSQGLGKYFFAWLLKDIANHGVRHARLEVMVTNQKAIALYKKMGFQIAMRLSNYYHKQQKDAYRLISPSFSHPSFLAKIDFCLGTFSQNLAEQGFILPPSPQS